MIVSSCYRKNTPHLHSKKNGKMNGRGAQRIFSHGTSNSRGVAILFPANFEYKILEKYIDKNGRSIILKCKFEDSVYILINCYGPTQQHRKEQIEFLNHIKPHIFNFEHENIIMGEDFNFYIDPNMDRQTNMSSRDNPVYRQEIVPLLDSFNLADSWRECNPNSRRFTWHSRGKSSRLDYFFIS